MVAAVAIPVAVAAAAIVVVPYWEGSGVLVSGASENLFTGVAKRTEAVSAMSP